MDRRPDMTAPPRKKIKVEAAGNSAQPPHPTTPKSPSVNNQRSSSSIADAHAMLALKELEVGITEFVVPHRDGFSGILKQRYTDFLVNEILPNGEVAHVDNFALPEKSAPTKVNPPESDVALNSKSANEQTAIETAPTGNSEENILFSEFGTSNPLATESAPKPVVDKEDDKSVQLTWKEYTNKHPNYILSEEDKSVLDKFFGDEVTTKIVELFNHVVNSPHRNFADYGTVTSDKITDRSIRTEIHHAIRRIFVGRLDSYTNDEGFIVITIGSSAASAMVDESRGRNAKHARTSGKPRDQPRAGHRSNAAPRKSPREIFAEHGGDHVHFSVCKMNKDTMEVIGYLARQLQVRAKTFQFAGTKDRRAVTVQRVSAYRILSSRLERVARNLRGTLIGNYEHHPHGLSLGDLSGNEFVITLRDCQFPDIESSDPQDHARVASDIVGLAMRDLTEQGFLNYYGLQRFGSFNIRTDLIGMKILQGDFKGAVDAILTFDASNLESPPEAPYDRNFSDDHARAVAINILQTMGNFKDAYGKLPKKYLAEGTIIRFLTGDGQFDYLDQNRPHNYLGSIQSIPRNLRLMYVHAYQSVIWNLAASYRWKHIGKEVVEGDLVLVNEHQPQDQGSEDDEDADGEPIVRPAADDRARSDRFERARLLTRTEVESGSYTIYDIVLPLPGFDVLYPSYMVEFYKSTMGSDEYGNLDPEDMRRPQKDFSLSGSYRKLLAKPGPSSFEVLAYTEEDKQFVETDLDRAFKATSNTPRGQSHNHKSPDKVVEDNAATVSDGRQPTTEALSHDVETNDVKAPEKKEKLAVIIRFQLGASQYATMALRELSKGLVLAYKPEFGSGG